MNDGLLARIDRTAAGVCTQKELDALAAYVELGNLEAIARRLGITPRAVAYRLKSAERKIQASMEKEDAMPTPPSEAAA